MAYSAKIVELDGTVVRTLVNCNIPTVVDELNAAGSATITIPKYETGSAVGQYDDLYLGREVQILDGATPIARGVPMHPHASSSDGAVSIELQGVGWYFTRRFIDAPISNLLTNPSFEDGLTGWTASGCTATVVTSPRRRGGYAVQLTGSTTGAEQFLSQIVYGVTSTAIGDLLTLAGWYQIDDGAWVGPAFESRGLYIELIDTSVVQTHNSLDGVIDDATPRDVWNRAEPTTWIPPNKTWDVGVRLYCPNGTVTYDALSLTKMESLAIGPGAGEDIATTANRIVAFIQDTANDKSDLSIGTTTPPTTGITFQYPKAWQYADHTPADRALNDEIVPLGVDWSITPDTKTFTVHYPRRGTDRSGSVTLTFPAGNLASYEYDDDNGQIETDVTMMGEGDGPDREEGRAVDTTELNGLVLQSVNPTPPGTTIDKLDDLATDRLKRAKRPVRLLSVVTVEKAGALASVLGVGDTVGVSINDGVIQLGGYWRITRRELTPRNNTLKLDLVEDTITWDSSAATWDSSSWTWSGFAA